MTVNNHHYRDGHEKCPVCHNDYLFRTREKESLEIRLYMLYRHKKNGVVYYHKIEYGEI